MSDLNKLIEEAKIKLALMSPEEKEEMYRKQREGYVKAEMSWPAPKFKMVNGVKVYESMEDYHNG